MREYIRRGELFLLRFGTEENDLVQSAMAFVLKFKSDYTKLLITDVVR